MVFVIIAALSGSGCKENVLINSKVSPAINTVGIYSVNLNCITHTFYDDTAVTSTNYSGVPINQAVGTYTDPFFGTMTAATYFQVIQTDPGSSIFENAIIDSAILVLPYSGYTMGDLSNSTATQTYQAFYMTQPINHDSVYNSYETKGIDATFPLSEPVTINVKSLMDSFNTNVIASNYPGLRMKLKLPVFWNHIHTADSMAAGSSSFTTDFIKYFNGICVRAANTNQFGTVIPYFRLDGNTIYNQAGVLLYYHTTTSDSALIEPYYHNVIYCGHMNSVSKSYNHYPVNALYHSTKANDDIIAIQNLPGATVDVVVPGLKTIPKGVIAKAELMFTVLDNYDNYVGATFLGPQKLYPTGIGNGVYPTGINYGLTYILADYYPITSTSPLGVLDGYYHNINGKRVYTINIPREVLYSLQSNNDTLHLHINGTGDYYGASHLVMGGGSYSDTAYRPKLFIVYSKLN